MLGMDGIEIDLAMTKDGVVVLSHDNNLDRVTDIGTTNISSLNWSDIKDHPLEVGFGTGDRQYYVLTAADAKLLNTLSNYKSHYGEAAAEGGNHYLARFDDVLELVKEQGKNTLLTLDKMSSKELFVACYKLLKEHNMLGQVMFKMSSSVDTVNEWATAAASACGITQDEVKKTFMMLYVIGKPNQSALQNHLQNGSYLKAVESTYGEANAESYEAILANGYLDFCKANGVDFYPSTIGPRWSGGRDDDETTWLHFLKLGVDGIMVDRPEEFAGFMYYYNGAKRTTSELIQAEHFQNFDESTAQFYMNEAADVNNNKLVNDMHSGDWLQYNNITFTGSEATIYVSAKGVSGGTLKFYVDSLSAANLFASVTFGKSDYSLTRSAKMLKTVSAGTHKVFVVASGSSGIPLISFDSFTFAEQSDDHYLFFDFTNTNADKTRYAKSIYGGYNFDTAGTSGYWSTNATAQGESTNQINYTIDNKSGVAVVTVGDDYENEKNYCGPKFMTTNTYGIYPWGGRSSYAPLQYATSASDYLVVRFKVDGCKKENDTLLFMEGWCTTNGTSAIKYEQIKADYDFVQGEYQTVIAPLPDVFKNADTLNSLGLRFTGLLSSDASNLGTVTIDYIYVGPMQPSDSVLIDFDEERGSYEDAVYGGMNYDLENRWSYNSSRSTAPEIADGALSYSVISSCTVNYHRMMLANANLTYTPGDDDYCQIRFKVDNGQVVSGKTASVNVYYSTDLYGTKGYGGKNNDSATFDLTAINNNGYYVLNVPMDEAYYRDAGIIRSMGVMFNNVDCTSLATFTIDYIYIGALDKAPTGEIGGALFFDFENTARDQARYDCTKYGFYNFDQAQNGYWSTNATASGEATNERNFTIDNTQGVAVITVGDDTEGEKQCGPKFMTTNTYGVFPWTGRGKYAPLNYDPSDAEVIQIRFKIDNCVSTGSNTIQMEYHYNDANGADAIRYGALNAAYSFVQGEYQVVTAALPSVFTSASKITSLGLRFMCIKSPDSANLGTVTIDYIYVGSEENVPYQDLLYFDFTDASADRARYGTKTYGYTNFDEASNWRFANLTDCKIANGVFTGALTASSSLRTSIGGTSSASDCPLQYFTGDNDYLQIRYKISGASSNAVRMKFYCLPSDSTTWEAIVNTTYAFQNNEYTYVTIDLSSTKYPSIEQIRGMQVNFLDVADGTLTVDYIYLGSEADLPTKHNYVATVTAPTCTEQGYTTHVCANCSDSYVDSYTKATGHTEVTVTGKDATCTTAGKTDGKKCSVCGVTTVAQTTIPAKGHTEKTLAAVAPTCTESGLTEGKQCTVCNTITVAQQNVAALGHDYSSKVTSATCTAQGYTTYTCTRCSDTYKDAYTNATGHSYTAKVTAQPTCTATGVKTFTCGKCGDSYTQSIPANGHDYKATVTAPTCTENGFTTYTCSACKDTYTDSEVEALGHSYDEGKVTKETTCTEEGIKTFTCPCGDSYAESIAKLGHVTTYYPEKNATCTEDGYSEHYYCSGCRNYYTDEACEYIVPWEYLSVAATGHALMFVAEKAPTCTEEGYGAYYHCEGCGESFFDGNGEYPLDIEFIKISALGHSAVIDEAIAPTCTESGLTEGKHCAVCGEILVARGILDALGHTEVIDEAVAPTCTESGLTEGKHCAVCGKVLVARGILDALGHSYFYTDNGENHTVDCENCDYSVTEGHNFVDGTCICGAKEVVEPKYEYDENLGMTMNISVGAEMQVMYTILNARVKNFESFYVEVVKDVVGGESVKTVFSLDNGNMDEISAPNGNLVGYSATYTGIFAMEMGDNFTATLYAVAADGTIYYGDSESSSIKTYLMEKLADSTSTAELKTLAVDMLNYGAAAQVNFNYDAENLVNADLTDEQKLLGTQETPSATDSSVTNGDGGRITTSVSLQSKVLLYVNCSYAKTENSNLEFVVKNLNGDVLERFAPTVAAAKMCQGVYGNVGARQMRDLITIELYDNGVLVSQTLTWNIESYVAQTREASASSDALISTVNAMLAYGDSAAIYLTASGQ